jgi:hypothetical protein
MCTLESDYRYDHATPLDVEGTLARALDSLKILNRDDDFVVAVVAASTREEIKQAVEIKARTILAQFEYDFPVFLIGPDELVLWRRRLIELGIPEYDRFLTLNGYSNIRNMCLLAGILTSAETVIFFDDDQIYEDKDYLNKALEFVGREHEGQFVGAVTGYYLQAEDSYFVPVEDTPWQHVWGAAETINRALALVEQPPRLKKTPFAFGGNMVIHRRVFEKVPFDPMMPRGEDIDYLMNCKFLGYDFYLDNELWIRHMPPAKCAPAWHQLRQDIIRFARERAKLSTQRAKHGYHRVEPSDFDPYPGRFLRDDLHDRVLAASLEMAGQYVSNGLERDADECMNNVAICKSECKLHEDAWGEYIAFQKSWQEFVEVLPTLGIWSAAAGMD